MYNQSEYNAFPYNELIYLGLLVAVVLSLVAYVDRNITLIGSVDRNVALNASVDRNIAWDAEV